MFHLPVDAPRQAELLLAALEHVGDGVSVFDANLALVACNRRFMELLDFPPDQARQWRTFEDFIRYNAERGEYGAGDADALVAERVAKASRFEPHEFRRIRPDGTVIEIRGAPLPGGGFVTTYRDVSLEVEVHSALQSEQDFNEKLVDSLPGIFYLITPDGRFLRWNRNFERVTGYSREEMAELHPLDLFEGEERDLIATAIGYVFEHGAFEVEASLVTKRGRHIHYYFSGVRIETGEEPALIGLGIDITGRKTAENLVNSLNTSLEERVRQRTAELESRNRELEAFSYSVAHDLRGPLRAIDGFSHLLLEDCGAALSAEGHAHLGRIRAASQRLGELIDNLLDLARISRHEVAREPVDLSARVAALSLELAEQEPHRSVEWRIDPDAHAVADPVLLGHVIDNLIRNAWKFTAERAPARIQFGHYQDGGETVFYVQDNGAGFDMAFVDKLFKPFQRLHHPTRFPGTGIGLAIVARVVERHGGRLWAEATPDQGATFRFTLPSP